MLKNTKESEKTKWIASKLHYATRTTISDYETARRGINIDVVVAYADLFDVSVDWILRGTDSFKKESGSETDDLLSIFFSIRDPKIRKVAIEQIRILAKLC